MKKEDAEQRPLTAIVTSQPKDLIEQNIQGQEQAFQTLMKLAMSATTVTDWADMGGVPYLQAWGSKKIALRFGASIYMDRNKDGDVSFQREDFGDQHGPYYVYTVTGKAVIGEREFMAIGTASTRDQFLGMENEKDAQGRYVKGQDGKTNKVPVALHEAVQDAKKKAVTNFQNNAIKSILGIGGFSWDDLVKFGLVRAGAKVEYKAAKPKEAAKMPDKIDKAPFWTSEFNGTQYINLRTGNHFSEEWCQKAGMRAGKNPNSFYAYYSQELWDACTKQFNDVENAEFGA